MLLEFHGNHAKVLKQNFYASGKRAGRLLAKSIAAQRTKTKIPIPNHPDTKQKMYNPQDIADSLIKYYTVAPYTIC